jgi:hypothetical protein
MSSIPMSTRTTSPTEWSSYIESGLEPVPAGLEAVLPQNVQTRIENTQYQQLAGYPQQHETKDQIIADYVASVDAMRGAPMEAEPERICGMRKKPFFLAFIFGLLIIGGALAGGLGGGLSTRAHNDNKNASQSR